MNLATPILVCHQNEDFRSLIREMLTKHGFFHVLEAGSTDELLRLMGNEKNQFLLVQGELIDPQLSNELVKRRSFLVLVQPEDEKSLGLAARFGVRRLVSFPFSSQFLLERMNLAGRSVVL